MSWASELWDQYENLSSHTNKGIDFIEKYGQFIKDRTLIELDYASKLRRLVKNYQPKKKEEEDYKFSSCQAFIRVMEEVSDIAGQHETIAENLVSKVCKEIAVLVKELKEERKKYLHDGAKYQSDYQNSVYQLEKAKKAYEKAFRESEKANEHFIKADEDVNLSRAEVAKAKLHYEQKNQISEISKTEYANHHQKTNELQRVHFSDRMPSIFQHLQDMDERRISCLQNFIKVTADIQWKVLPIITKCLEGIVDAAETINPKEDSQIVIDRYKSGYGPPEDFPFEDLSNQRNCDISTNSLTVPSIKNDFSTVRGTVTVSGKSKKRTKIFSIFSKNCNEEIKEDYSNLPPNQQKKKLQEKINTLQSNIHHETTMRDALNKMKDVYTKDPTQGDLLLIEGQLAENGIKLQKLQAELQRFTQYMTDVDTPKSFHPQLEHRHSISEDSLSRSASDSSVSNPTLNSRFSAPNTPQTSHGSSNSPESGIGTSRNSIPDPEDPDPDFDHDDFDLEPLPVLGTARALYVFNGHGEGSISIQEGEDFDVVELDQGDGWTRVRKHNFDEGFVPTSYIDCHLYNNC